jgi:hypothetical protein
MHRVSRGLVFVAGLLAAGCSGPPQPSSGSANEKNHVWSAQTGALEKAKGVERTLEDAARERGRLIEQQEH